MERQFNTIRYMGREYMGRGYMGAWDSRGTRDRVEKTRVAQLLKSKASRAACCIYV